MKCTIAVMLILAAGVAHAGDGAVEINQASVLAAGGFPFTISQAGKYVLTSNLTVPDVNTSGILITARHVTLDLGGFGVFGVPSRTPRKRLRAPLVEKAGPP